MKIYLDNNLGVEKVEQEELTQDTYGYNILKVYIPNAVLATYDTFTCYYGALLQNGRKVGWFSMEARTNSDADYEANYTLYKATLEQSVVSVEGKVYIGCQVILGNSGNATLIKKNTAVVQFNVRKSVAINNDILILDPSQTNTDVLESYKQLLENALTTYATKAEVNSKLDLKADKSDTYTKAQTDNLLNSKADKSDTYTKQEVNQLTDGLSGEIDTVRKSVNSLNTRTSILENTVDDLRNAQQLADVVPTYFDLQEYYATRLDQDDKVQVLSDDTHDGDSTVYKWDGSNWIYLGSYSSNTYNKTEVDNLLNDKADKSNTYNKTEVDGKFDGVGKEFETLSNDILSLQTSVSDLKSVQNVVDVVPTYSDLQSYDTSKLETNDKIQVIADETHSGASTIYKWDGSAWIYVGAFGGNSYTKPEVDTKLSTKADKDDTYTKQEVNDKLNGYIKNDDTTYSATVRGQEVIVSGGTGYGSTTYKHNSIQTSNPSKPSCDYSFPDEKSGTLALTSDIPTVNNPTITFTQGGTTKGTITLNQSGDQTIELDAGLSGGSYTAGDGIDITNNVISVDNTIAKKSEIPTNYVTLDTEQTITGLKTIGKTSGTISEVDFSGFTFKLSNKAINHPEADIKIRNASYDGYQYPTIYSTKGLYVNLAKIKLGDDGSNTYGITMPDSSTWESDKVLATIDDIPTVNNPTITFTQGGETKGSITLNQASDQTIDLDAGGSSVIANPTLSGDEATLNGVEIDGTKYKVGGGSGSETHLYQHLIKFTSTNHQTIETTMLSTSNTPVTKNTFFYDLGGNIYSNFTQCPVYSSNTIKYVKGAYETPGGSYKAIIDTYVLENGAFTKSTNEINLGTIEDKVIQIF